MILNEVAELVAIVEEVERLEARKAELTNKIASQVLAKEKAQTFEVHGKTVRISKRDYKKFDDDTEFLLEREKNRFKDEIKAFDAVHKQNSKAIKDKAIQAGNFEVETKYYLKVN